MVTIQKFNFLTKDTKGDWYHGACYGRRLVLVLHEGSDSKTVIPFKSFNESQDRWKKHMIVCVPKGSAMKKKKNAGAYPIIEVPVVLHESKLLLADTMTLPNKFFDSSILEVSQDVQQSILIALDRAWKQFIPSTVTYAPKMMKTDSGLETDIDDSLRQKLMDTLGLDTKKYSKLITVRHISKMPTATAVFCSADEEDFIIVKIETQDIPLPMNKSESWVRIRRRLENFVDVSSPCK